MDRAGPPVSVRRIAEEDVETVVELVHELAAYEKAADQCHLTGEALPGRTWRTNRDKHPCRAREGTVNSDKHPYRDRRDRRGRSSQAS